MITLRRVKGPDGIAGSGLQTTVIPVSPGKSARLQSVRFTLTTDANVANRSVDLRLFSSNQRPVGSKAIKVIAASSIVTVNWCLGAVAWDGVATAGTLDVLLSPLPQVTFDSDFTVTLNGLGYQAGDIASDIEVVFIEGDSEEILS